MSRSGSGHGKNNWKGQETKIIEAIRIKEILGDALKLLTSEDGSNLKKILNTVSWKVKKAILQEAIERGKIWQVDRLASEILNLTEVKKAALEANVNINENVQILMAEIKDVPYEVIEQRAKQLRELKRLRARTSGTTDDGGQSGEVLVLQDGAVSE